LSSPNHNCRINLDTPAVELREYRIWVGFGIQTREISGQINPPHVKFAVAVKTIKKGKNYLG